jgi:osmotically-inducible protein OsmY
LAKGGTFEIRNTNGQIDVSPSDNDQISVVAEKIAKAGTDDAAKTAADEIEIRETVSADAIVLDAKMSLTGLFGGSRQVKFHIKAPKGTTLRLSNTNGAIDITDMRGELRLETTNGAVKAVGIAGPTRAITTNGAVVLDFDSLPEGAVSAETTNGAVSMTIPREAKANLSVRVTNGGISIDGLDVTVTEKSRRRLDGTLNGGGTDVRVETTNGGVRLRGR